MCMFQFSCRLAFLSTFHTSNFTPKISQIFMLVHFLEKQCTGNCDVFLSIALFANYIINRSNLDKQLR